MRRAFAVMLLLAVLVAAGCGSPGRMSPSEYQESISDLHDGLAVELGEAFETLSSLSYDDYYDLVELQAVFENARNIFASAETRAREMIPPEDQQALHDDLLLFYTGGKEMAGGMAESVNFIEVVLPMLSDVENLALFNLPDSAGFPEIKAAAAEDLTSMGEYIASVERMDPPEELVPLQEKLAELFRSIDEAAREVDGTVTPENTGPFLLFRQGSQSFLETKDALWGEAQAYLRGLPAMVDAMIENGKALAKRIQDL